MRSGRAFLSEETPPHLALLLSKPLRVFMAMAFILFGSHPFNLFTLQGFQIGRTLGNPRKRNTERQSPFQGLRTG